MDTVCHIDSSWGDEFTDQQVAGCYCQECQQVAGHKNSSKDMQGPDIYAEPIDGPSYTDDITDQKVAGHKNLSKDRQGRAAVLSVNDGFTDQQAAGPFQKNSASDTPDPVNLPSVTDEFTDESAIGPCQKNTTAKSEENASPTEVEDPSIDTLTDSANIGNKKFLSKIYYLQPPAVWAHADVRLVSSDGMCFKVNAAMLALTSSHLGNVLKSLPDGEDAVISTELCAYKLKLFIEFVTTGTLSVNSLDPVLDDFACLGVDLLNGYKFQMSYSATSDPLNTAYLVNEESEKKVVSPSVSGILRKPQSLLIPKSQPHTLKAEKRDQVPAKKRKLVETDVRQARRERREREKQEKAGQSIAPPESREPKLETCNDIFIEYDLRRDEDKGIEREAVEKSSAQKRKNTLKMSSSAIIATNYFVRKEKKCTGHSGSHEEKKQESNASTIKCSVPRCSKVFQDASEYYRHVMNCPPREPPQKKNKRNEPAQKIVCSECGMQLANRYWLRYHLESFHTESKTFKCPQCPKMFASERLVNKHIKTVHDTYICDLCGRLVKRDKERNHKLLYHTPEDQKPLKCKICIPVKGFLYQGHLDEHMNIHMGIKPFKCTSCPGVAYANNANLSAHMRSVHKGIKRKPKNSSISK